MLAHGHANFNTNNVVKLLCKLIWWVFSTTISSIRAGFLPSDQQHLLLWDFWDGCFTSDMKYALYLSWPYLFFSHWSLVILVSYLFIHSCNYCYSDLAQARFIFTIFLPIPIQCWNYMCIPLNLIIVALIITIFSYVKYLNYSFSEIIYIYFTTWKKSMSLLKSKID